MTSPLGLDLGAPDAPPVLLLHGFLGQASDFEGVARHLEGDFRLLAPDLPGHGRALGLPPAAYTMDGAADALAALLDVLAVEHAALVGYSMGGRLALHFALRHPARVGRLVVLGASPGLRTEEERAARRRLDAVRAEAIQRDLLGFLDSWYAMPLFADLGAAVRARLVRRRLANDRDELARALEGLGTGVQPSHWEHLHRIRVGAWAVAGARDEKFARLAVQMAEAGPFEAVTLPAAGHALLEHPAALALLLRRVLK